MYVASGFTDDNAFDGEHLENCVAKHRCIPVSNHSENVIRFTGSMAILRQPPASIPSKRRDVCLFDTLQPSAIFQYMERPRGREIPQLLSESPPF